VRLQLHALAAIAGFVGCPGPSPGKGDPLDTGDPHDTGAAGGWPALASGVGWASDDVGVATGAGSADMDGDGDADWVVAYGNDIAPGPLVVYENVDGTLDPAPLWQSADPHFYGHLDIGDVNGDGALDVVVSRYLGDAGWEDVGGVDLFLGDGAGGLGVAPAWSMDDVSSFSCALGDVDRDGDLDLAVAAGEGYRGPPETSRIYTNEGGTWAAAPSWEGPAGFAVDVAWADLDGDGWLDLAMARLFEPHAVFYGDGSGGMEENPGWTAEGAQFEGNTLDWGDVNGDGWLDLAVSDNRQQGGPGVVHLYCGPDLGLCWESAGPKSWSAVSLEDVDGDGRADLAAGQWWGGVQVWFTSEASPNSPLPASASWRSDPVDLVVEALTWADLDGSHAASVELTGEGLVAVPGRARVLTVEGGVAAGGWISGPGTVTATVLAPSPRDLLVTDWTSSAANIGFLREVSE
jgi:hypothetical protein